MTVELVKQIEHKPKTNWPQPIKSKAIKLAEAGFSLGDIKKILGVPLSTVQGWVAGAGVQTRPAGGVKYQDRTSHERIIQICFMYDRLGMNSIELAEKFGYKHYSSITRILKKGGVPIRPRSERNRKRAA